MLNPREKQRQSLYYSTPKPLKKDYYCRMCGCKCNGVVGSEEVSIRMCKECM